MSDDNDTLNSTADTEDLREARMAFVIKNAERVVTNLFPHSYGRSLRNDMRSANGFVGQGFVSVRISEQERITILDSLFGKERWSRERSQ
jgi:hypothetical protein